MIEFICGRKDLLTALQKAKKFVGRRKNYEALFTCRESELAITVSDSSAFLRQKVKIDNYSSLHTAVINCSDFLTIVKSIKDKTIEARHICDGAVSVNGTRLSYCEQDENFMNIPVVESEYSFAISAKDLQAMIRQTVMCTSDDITRHFMMGCYLHCEDGIVKMAATDGRRLSLIESNCRYDRPFGVIIPTDICKTILSVSCDGEVAAYVGFQESNELRQVSFSFPGCSIFAKCSAAKFPDYHRVIPESFAYSADIGRTELLEAAELCGKLTAGKRGNKGIVLDITDGTMTISAKEALNDIVIKSVSINLHDINGPADSEFHIGINPDYFTQALHAMEFDLVRLCLNDDKGPLKLQCYSNGFHIIMPRNL